MGHYLPNFIEDYRTKHEISSKERFDTEAFIYELIFFRSTF